MAVRDVIGESTAGQAGRAPVAGMTRSRRMNPTVAIQNENAIQKNKMTNSANKTNRPCHRSLAAMPSTR